MGNAKTSWYAILLLMAGLAVAAFFTTTWHMEGRNQAEHDTPESPPRHYTLIGHEEDIFKGPPFTPPVENRSLRPAGWEDQPVVRNELAADADLAISLDQQLYSQLAPHIAQFAREKGLNIAVNRGTCGVSAKQLHDKSVDIAGFCCPPGTGDRLPGLKFHTLGISALALLVHKNNPVDEISIKQARAIFRGSIQHWAELGADQEDRRGIVVTTRLHCKTRPGHWKLISGDEQTFSTYAQDVGDIPSMFLQVGRFEDTIGFETLTMRKREDSDVKVLRLEGMTPDNLTALAKGYYPFYRVYNLTTWTGRPADPLAEELVAYLAQVVEDKSDAMYMAPASQLRANGWTFLENELVAEPGQKSL